jgi:hypothetical protein
LQSIGRAQILGTQFMPDADGKMGQGQYDKALIPDSLREALGVPSLADQDIERQRYEAERAAAKK